MTYVFAGAFCEDRPGQAEALRAVFPASLRRRFTRADSTSDVAPDDLWCPKAGLLAVTQASKYTLGFNVFDRTQPESDADEFFETLDRVLPEVAERQPVLALSVECAEGVCGAEMRVYERGERTYEFLCSPDLYHQQLVIMTDRIGCNLHFSATFPPLSRGAFHLMGQPF